MNPDGPFRPSRICKLAMLTFFRKVVKEMGRGDLASLATYHEAKVSLSVPRQDRYVLGGGLGSNYTW